MPEHSKKHQQKSKHDPKDQRKPRQQRQQAAAEKKVEKGAEEVKAQAQPVYEDPGPEFYKNLKRETDEILKITEEANSKYKKKEIQSNWAKYEMPIESYEAIDEHEDLGADYEKLAQVPLSIGGHFQFKHEKSWDVDSAPSLYDKYFEINMDNLATAISTIPFYERNKVDQSLFTQTDMLTMDNRSIKYKQRYYNDKSYSTSELEAQEKILKDLKEKLSETEDVQDINVTEKVSEEKDMNFEDTEILELEPRIKQNTIVTEKVSDVTKGVKNDVFEDLPILGGGNKNKVEAPKNTTETLALNQKMDQNVIVESYISPAGIKEKTFEKVDQVKDDIDSIILSNVKKESLPTKVEENAREAKLKQEAVIPESVPKNPVIESPEDLEKWLDDFLEG